MQTLLVRATRAAERVRRRALLGPSIVVGAAYTAYAVHLTWPLAVNPNYLVVNETAMGTVPAQAAHDLELVGRMQGRVLWRLR